MMFLDDQLRYREIGLERFLAAVEKRAFGMARVATGGNTEDALDIVQDAMLAFVRKYAAKPESDWRPLFFRVLQNQIRDWFRRQAVRNRWRGWLKSFQGADEAEQQEDPLERVADEKSPEAPKELERRETMAALSGALHKLPDRQQQAFLLRAWEGMSIVETAAAMECSAGSVKSHYARAISSLRQELEDHWP